MWKKSRSAALVLLLVACTNFPLFSQTGIELYQKSQEAFGQGKSLEAIALAEKAAALIKKDSGENSLPYADVLGDLGWMYISVNALDKAESVLLISLEIVRKENGTQSMEYVAAIQNIATLSISRGDSKSADRYMREALGIIEERRGKHDSTYAIALNLLGNIAYNTQDYSQSIVLISQALDIYKKYYPQRVDEYVYMLSNLGESYSSIGAYKKSLAYFDEAIALFRSGSIPAVTPLYTKLLNNVAVLQLRMLNYGKSEAYLKMALENHLKILPKTHPDYITTINSLGYLEYQQKKYTEAATLYKQVLDLWEQVAGSKSPHYATTLNNLALVYIATGDYPTADSLFTRAMQVYRVAAGTSNLHYAEAMHNLGYAKQAGGNAQLALGNYRQADSLYVSYMARNFYGLSEHDKLNLTSSMQLRFQAIPSLIHLNHSFNNQETAEEVFHIQLALKNMVLRAQQSLSHALRNSHDPATVALYDEWRKHKTMLVEQYAKQPGGKTKSLDSLEKATDDLEQVLSGRSSLFSQNQQYFHLSVKDISAKLRAGETAIEFLRYTLYNKRWTDSVFYAALIIRPGAQKPEYVRLCAEAELIKVLKPAGCSVRDEQKLLADLYQPLRSRIGVSRGDLLYDKIWKPLLGHLQGARSVFVSPAGLLHQVAFQAIPSPGNHVLGDMFSFRYLLSTGDIAVKELDEEDALKRISFWGNMNYDYNKLVPSDSNATKNVTGNMYFEYTKGKVNDCQVSSRWPALNYAQKQVAEITWLCQLRKIPIDVHQQANATEERLKSLLLELPSVLHISTHGFFIRDSVSTPGGFADLQSGFTPTADPLLRSGIVLTGANAAWTGKKITASEDGVVTAYEIANMDLSNASLVILDACESALGSIYGSEGVFGLQRAFKIAGADKVMMSLWRVPEKETNDLMMKFYKHWLAGTPVHKALREAQEEMRKKNLPPYYWAGFIVAE